ncbi:TetR/AcrR family transcriptional regulator [Planobispora takensis]|uniref:DNA-binding protein n=1 Tax=Planobispora takensis TaxID=1367882 RepID=A0A8J3SVR5_9ACTN|nr:TetR/AcrR family transcriptional regulator [Planobispora takensis]GIH99687.1 DNA-binding protein [Planobispora takensis]
MIAAAAECFVEKGYAETTMKDIAARAGVSAPTVYAQGAKAELLLAAVERSLVGDAGPEAVRERDRFRRLLEERDKKEKLRLLREIALDRPPMSGEIMRSFREAAPGDPEIAGAWEEYRRRRYAGMRVLVESFAHLLRPGLTVERAADVFWAVFDEQTTEALLGRGWAPVEYVDWMVDAMDRLLLR